MNHNRLAYARQSFHELYGFNQERFARVAASAIAPGSPHRLWAPFDSSSFGPLNGTLDTRTDVTYGYNPLALRRYSRYLQAAGNNPKLLDSLAVTAKLNTTNGLFTPNPTALARISVPPSVSAIAGSEEAERRVASLDPAKEALIEGGSAIPQNGPADLQLMHDEGGLYRVRSLAARPVLLRLAVPYFPGWRAEIDGRVEKVVPVDLALMGVVAPEGTHEIVFRFHSNWFVTGAVVSTLAWLAAAVWLVWSFRLHREPRESTVARSSA